MKKIQRFNPSPAVDDSPHNQSPMVSNSEGEYVKFSDFLTMRRDLMHSRKHLKGVVNAIAKLVQRNQKNESLTDAVKRVLNNQK